MWQTQEADVHFVSNIRQVFASGKDQDMAHCQLDSHADTCCAGSNMLLIMQDEQKVSVCAYSDSIQPITDIPIMMVATLWEDLMSGHSLVLIICKALFLGEKLRGSLLNPNQLHANGVQVEDVP